ncbi:MAG: PEP-CTERM sorting domain-containing protein [Gemmataceae bacterium]|nr:PEP-CTERM sorting domain-containing protein [Gemmataceae bacterium]
MKTFRLGWITLGLASIVLSVAIGVRASGEVIKVVAPASHKNVEGVSFVTPAAAPIRVQHLMLASEFGALPASHRLIVAFNFRADNSQTQPVDWGSGEERIWMSTTNLSDLTAVFGNNHGADKTLVHDGPIRYPLLATGPAGGPRDIADGRLLDTAFFYDPSQGNLLVERLVFSTNPSPRANLDAVLSSQNLVLVNNTDPLNATSGTFVAAPAVLQFEFVPEPSTFVLAGIAMVGVVGWRLRRLRLRKS